MFVILSLKEVIEDETGMEKVRKENVWNKASA